MIELKDIPDEEFLHNIRTSGVLRRYDGLQDRVLELIRRYNNKKNECEAMRRNQDVWYRNVEGRLVRAREILAPSNFLLSSET